MGLKGRQRTLPKLNETDRSVTIVFVKWIDSAMTHDQVPLTDLPDIFVVYSAGVLLHETEDRITFAADTMMVHGEPEARQITTVPKVCVIELKKFTA